MKVKKHLFGRATDRPGSVSFSRVSVAVSLAADSEDWMRTRDSEELTSIAQALRVPDLQQRRQSLAEYLALVREFGHRALDIHTHDNQLLAVAALLNGNIVEMDTGEGKTFVGAAAACAFVFMGRRVHVLSPNDYLAARDQRWMLPFLEFMGVTSSSISQKMTSEERRSRYEAEVVYAPLSEVGFDVLRDRLIDNEADAVSPSLDVVIADEADSLLLDDASVPLILAGESLDPVTMVARAAELASHLDEKLHYTVDDERLNVLLTDAGLDELERQLGIGNLYDSENLDNLTKINLALHARVLLRRDVDYLIDNDQVKVVNTSRGRVVELQRWPDGLQAAIEAKEGVPVTQPGIVLDTITVQELVNSYSTIVGMSGTIVSVADELQEVYGVKTGRIEPHRQCVRVDHEPVVFLTAEEKLTRLTARVGELHRTRQPVLVGTQSVAESELIASRLRAESINVTILNAKNDADEAAIISLAGEVSAVTISTQMSGRGTDIRLGGTSDKGHDEVAQLGGLAVIASSLYPSMRLDSQLHGRSGRQGDPGSSETFVSLEDDIVLMNVPDFTLRRIRTRPSSISRVERLRIARSAQRISEGQRMDHQRATSLYNRAISLQRKQVLNWRQSILTAPIDIEDLVGCDPAVESALATLFGPDKTQKIVRYLLLFELDLLWQEHLEILGEIRDGIHLEALAGNIPADSFHLAALHQFDDFEQRFKESSRHAVVNAIENPTHPLPKRPSATWTFMTSDSPFGSKADRLVRPLAKKWRTLMRI